MPRRVPSRLTCQPAINSSMVSKNSNDGRIQKILAPNLVLRYFAFVLHCVWCGDDICLPLRVARWLDANCGFNGFSSEIRLRCVCVLASILRSNATRVMVCIVDAVRFCAVLRYAVLRCFASRLRSGTQRCKHHRSAGFVNPAGAVWCEQLLRCVCVLRFILRSNANGVTVCIIDAVRFCAVLRYFAFWLHLQNRKTIVILLMWYYEMPDSMSQNVTKPHIQWDILWGWAEISRTL